MDATHPQRPPSPLEQGRRRDELITDIPGPFWAQLLVQMNLFPNYEKAAKRIRRLFKKGEVKFLGKCEVCPGHRDSFIYGTQRVKEQDLHHEVSLSRMLAKYRGFPILRLYDVDPILRPDATMVIGGITYHWEYHTGTEGLSQVRERLRLYENRDCVLLFVCRKEKQIAKVRSVAEALGPIIHFSSLPAVVGMKTPWDKVWWSYDGVLRGVTAP